MFSTVFYETPNAAMLTPNLTRKELRVLLTASVMEGGMGVSSNEIYSYFRVHKTDTKKANKLEQLIEAERKAGFLEITDKYLFRPVSEYHESTTE